MNQVAPLNAALSGRAQDARLDPIPDAIVSIKENATGKEKTITTDQEGAFTFAAMPPGSYDLTITREGFNPVTRSGIVLAPGQNLELGPIRLDVAAVTTGIQVVAPQADIAVEQVKLEEKQRLLGVLPNYFVSYFPHPAPLTAGQKMRLAIRTAVDPTVFAVSAAIAGAQTGDKNYADYGTGGEGFGKRWGASYGNAFSGIMLSGGVLPALLHQDPRYYYRGTGSKGSRALYALSWAVRRKGDNGKWQPNYSGLLGDLAGAGISDLYLPSNLRDNAATTFQNSAISLGFEAVADLLQEFVFRKVTTHSHGATRQSAPAKH